MNDIPRRRLLAVAGATGAVALAGCSDDDADDTTDDGTDDDGGDENDGTETESESDEFATILGDIALENLHDESHTLDIIVEFDGEIVDWTTTDLEADSGETLDRNWPDEPGSVRVITRHNRDEPREVRESTLRDPDCVNLFFLITRGGELEIWSDTDGGPCGEGEAEPDEPEESE